MSSPLRFLHPTSTPTILLPNCGVQLQRVASYMRRSYFKAVLYSLNVNVPVQLDGAFDLARQKEIAAATQRFDLIRAKLHELGDWSQATRIA